MLYTSNVTLYLIKKAESYEINNLEHVTRICGIFEMPIKFRFSKTITNYEYQLISMLGKKPI